MAFWSEGNYSDVNKIFIDYKIIAISIEGEERSYMDIVEFLRFFEGEHSYWWDFQTEGKNKPDEVNECYSKIYEFEILFPNLKMDNSEDKFRDTLKQI